MFLFYGNLEWTVFQGHSYYASLKCMLLRATLRSHADLMCPTDSCWPPYQVESTCALHGPYTAISYSTFNCNKQLKSYLPVSSIDLMHPTDSCWPPYQVHVPNTVAIMISECSNSTFNVQQLLTNYDNIDAPIGCTRQIHVDLHINCQVLPSECSALKFSFQQPSTACWVVKRWRCVKDSFQNKIDARGVRTGCSGRPLTVAITTFMA